MMLLKLRQITKVVGNDKLQHAIDRFLPGVSHNFSKGGGKIFIEMGNIFESRASDCLV